MTESTYGKRFKLPVPHLLTSLAKSTGTHSNGRQIVKLSLCATALVAALASVAGHAQTPPTPTEGWLHVTWNSNGVYEAKTGSFEMRTNKSNEEVAVVTGKFYNTSTKRTDFQKWYVKVSDCQDKQGKVVTTALDGEFKYDTDFVSGGDTIGTGKADFICMVYDISSAAKRKKSL